ncbi:MAG: hypothetical protein HOM19_06495 [Candidatus Marinimicrobia bacterium]|nr:hypothetical protein [Candidatus Neomarinimicrobiota bacterium]
MNKVAIVLSLTFLLGEESPFSFNGYVDFAHISRLSDYSIIDIPYRMGSIDFFHQNKNISLNGNFTLEYQLRRDSYFLESKDPQDFRLDMRELYSTFSGPNFELRIGKQIHSWGNVDENSPLDNASAFDYYYIFFLGRERKMATLTGALDYYVGNLKLNAVFSPIHTTNRLPLGDDDFPITLPIYPDESQIFPIYNLPFEGGYQGTYSFGMGEISASYFSGFDRVFNFTGVNVYSNGSQTIYSPPDLVFGYRKTNVLGLGLTILNPYFIFRGDFAQFKTQDLNNSIDRPYSNSNLATIYDTLVFSYPIHEKASYHQSTLQIETELPFNINFIGQIFSYEIVSFSSDTLPDVEIDIPGFEFDPESMTPENFFTPGMGVPLAILTDKAAILILDRAFMNEQLNISLTTMLDLGDYNGVEGIPGSLTEYKIEYKITQDFLGLLGVTKVIGSKDHPDGEQYQFNKMEDFSHFRFELKYFF